jgi:hypothetical protein
MTARHAHAARSRETFTAIERQFRAHLTESSRSVRGGRRYLPASCSCRTQPSRDRNHTHGATATKGARLGFFFGFCCSQKEEDSQPARLAGA